MPHQSLVRPRRAASRQHCPGLERAEPHDLDAERVGVAFGGYASCLELVDVAAPTLRVAIERLTRQEPLPIRRDKRAKWRILATHQVPDCCARVPFASIEAAARHPHGSGHLAREHGAREWQLTPLLAAAERAWAWDQPPRDRDPEARRLVREAGGVADLWRTGIRPDHLPEIAAAVSAVTDPLPVSFYLGVVDTGADREGLRATALDRAHTECHVSGHR